MSYVTGRLLNVPNVNDIQKQINELNDKATELENTKQDKLVSGENIKTVDGNSIVGQGNVPFKTLNGEQLSGEGNIDIHNEPLTIKTGLSSGDVVYDGTEAVEVEISPITVTTEPVEYTYDSQLKFYREPTENEEQLGSIYYIGADQPITTTVQNTEEKIHDPIAAEDITKVFTAPFVDIFTEQEIEVSSKAFTYVKEYESESEEPQEDDGGEDTGDNNSEGPIKAAAKPVLDTYLQFGNGNGASGWIKLRLNKKQAYLWIKAKMFNQADVPGSIFVADDLAKLTNIDFNASEAADKLVFNYTETLIDSADEWQVIKVPVQSESQVVYITNGRNFGTPAGPSTTYDYKRDEEGHIIWERDPETGEIIGGDIDRDNPLYGGRILIKEIGIQYDEELGPKTLFTAEQFADYKATADYRFTNIETVNKAQSSYLDEIDTHLNRIDEEFTEKFNNLGDVQIYTVDELPEQVHADDKNKIFKCDNHYYVVDINPYDDVTTNFIFKDNEHTFDDNINSISSLIKSFNKIYDTDHETTLKSNFWIPDDSITQENKLFGSGNTYINGTGQDKEDLLGNQYLRFGSNSYGGKLVLEYRDSSNTKALTHISFKLLPWIGVTSIVDPETGERAKHIASLNKSAIKIYRNTEDNLIDAAEIDCGSIGLDEYEYSQEGFALLVNDKATNCHFEIQLMPGDKIIIKSDNNVIISGEEITGLDYRFFITGIDVTTENTQVEFKEPFVTTDTNQDNITGAKTFTNNFTIEHANSGAGLSVSDAVYMYGYKEIFGNTTVFGTIDFERNTNFYGITEFHTNPIFWDNIQIKSDISNGFDKSITVSEISTATNLENGNGNGSIIQSNVELGNITWISSNTDIATVDENGNVEAVGEGDVIITAIAENGASDECVLNVVNPDRINLMGSWNTTTVNTTIADYAADHNWEDNTAYNEIALDNNITVNITNQGSYTGKYFASSNDWRIYQSDAGSFEVRCSDTTKTIKTVKITYSSANSGIIVYNDVQYTSGSIIEVEAVSASMTFTVSRTGGTKQGQAKITAIEVVYGNYEPTLVEEINLNATELNLDAGARYQLVATVLPVDADNRDIIWSSSDSSVATVDSTGLVRAIAEGETTITVLAADGSGVSNSCTVSVTGAAIKEIQLNVNRATINLGEEIKLSAKYKDKNIADGDLAIALGLENEAHGDRSFVQGDHLVANEDNQVIFGSYNAQTDAKFVIAAGDENERFNALEVTAEGKVIAGVQTDDSDDDEVLTTKSYVDAKTGGSGSITIGSTTLTEGQLKNLLALLDTLEAKDAE